MKRVPTRLLIIASVAILYFTACSKQEDHAPAFSSHELLADGSCFVPDIGVPQHIRALSIGDSAAASGFLPPIIVPLHGPGAYNYAYCEGSKLYFGNDTAAKVIAARNGQLTFLQILSDNDAVYAIDLGSRIEAFDYDGKSLWKHQCNDNISGPSVAAAGELIVPTDSAFTAIDIHSGKELWTYRTTNSLKTPIYDAKLKLIVSAITFNNSNANDSMLCLSYDGKFISRCGFPGTRIISNICLCGKEKNKIAFGYIARPKEEGGMRTLRVAIYSGIQAGNPVKTSDHEVPYLATNIASNGQLVLASGFEQMAGNLESGIDAFYADDTTKIWQRRFTQPLVAPVAISSKFAYFFLGFETQASVPAKSIFYTLDLSTGGELGALPVTGITNGSVSGLPTPLGESQLVLCDASRPAIYFLKP